MVKPPCLCDLDEAIDSCGNFIISNSKLRKFFHHKCHLCQIKGDICVGVWFVF